MSLLGAAALTGAASLVGTGANALAQSNLNKKNRKFSREMWEKQGAREVEFWDMQNRYNAPAQQMSRLTDAGLNPHLVYGSGATTEASGLSPNSAQTPSTSAPRVDLGSVVGQALNARMTQATIDRTEAEAENIRSRTFDQNFRNSVNSLVGVENIAQAQASANDYLNTSKKFDLMKYETEMSAIYSSPDGKRLSTRDPNSPAYKAYRAGIQKTSVELENAVSLGNIRKFESEIKKFEASLTRQGISPNSPFYIKIIGDLLDRVLPGGLQSMSPSTNNNKQFMQTPNFK